MEIIKGDIPGLLILKPKVFYDERGYFYESWNSEKLSGLDFKFHFEQDNESCSAKGVIRALHFQNPPSEQGKLVRVVKGRIFDVAVDIRKGSPYFGKYQKIELSEQNKLLFWIPPGFAHGFIAVEEDTIVNYKCTSPYRKEAESSLLWNDPEIAIDWGISNPIVSEKDMSAMKWKDFKSSFEYNY